MTRPFVCPWAFLTLTRSFREPEQGEPPSQARRKSTLPALTLALPATRSSLGPGGSLAKLAVTLRASFIASLQGPLPEQPSPDQPVKVEPAAAVAVSVIFVLASSSAEQV